MFCEHIHLDQRRFIIPIQEWIVEAANCKPEHTLKSMVERTGDHGGHRKTHS